MKGFILALLVITSFAFQPFQSIASGPEAGGPDYLIGPGDVLFISVWKDQALTQSLPVRPDGKISFPLIGEITAGNRTVTQLQKELEEKLSQFIPQPTVSVGIQDIRSMFIYVIGRVNSPGRFAVNAPVDVLQALAMAGGCNAFAETKDIKIFRRTGTETRIMPFNYNDVSRGRNLEQNITLQRGDVIVVP
jgi:polysaccharide export outer membrane protein